MPSAFRFTSRDLEAMPQIEGVRYEVIDDVKLSLYSRQGVDEYWIVDWRARQVEVYWRVEGSLRPWQQ